VGFKDCAENESFLVVSVDEVVSVDHRCIHCVRKVTKRVHSVASLRPIYPTHRHGKPNTTRMTYE